MHATAVALLLGGTGLITLALAANGLAAALALATILVYVGLYTPRKTRTSLNTLVGAVCGAIPPMIGWAAAAGRLEAGAWILAALLALVGLFVEEDTLVRAGQAQTIS